MGIRTSNTPRDTAIMKVMKAWLTGHMLTESQKHLIRYVMPKPQVQNGSLQEATMQEEKEQAQRKEALNEERKNAEGAEWLALFRTEGDQADKPRETYKLWVSLNPFLSRMTFSP